MPTPPSNANSEFTETQTSLYDNAGHQFVAQRAYNVAQDGTTNIWYGDPATGSGGGGGGGAVTVADGADVTQGTSTDANTVASVMGRLTKIRDLLNATLTVAGTITEANSASIKTDLDTIVTNTNKIPASPAQEGGNLATLAGGITSSKYQINNAQVNGTTISINQGTVDGGTQRVAVGGAATGTKSNVASSASSVTILASNTSRKSAMVYNDSTQILYLDLSGGTASTSSYSVQVPAQGFFEVPGPTIYNGAITGIWASANGNARVTEFS